MVAGALRKQFFSASKLWLHRGPRRPTLAGETIHPMLSRRTVRCTQALILAFALSDPLFATPQPPQEEDALIALFTAIADFKKDALLAALNTCPNPNAGFPQGPAAASFQSRYPDGPLYYYLRKEPGYTPLMFACAVGNETAVRFLLAAGANPNQLSGKSKTFALWQAARHGRLEIMKLLMGITDDSEPAQFRISVNLEKQQAVVWKGREVVLITPISSGKSTTPTRTGRFLVTNKYRHWTSTIYEAKMPYFLRLSCGDFGLHAGQLPGYPASHGCVRLPEENAKQLFSMVPIGALVEIR